MRRTSILVVAHCLTFCVLSLASRESLAASVTLQFTAPPAYSDRAGFTVAFGLNMPPAGDITMGMEFGANAAITVTHLGYYAPNGTLSDPHEVGIFDRQTQALLVSTFVDPSDPLDGGFLYAAIAPLTLEEGKSYVIAGHTTAGSDFYNHAAASIAGPDIQLIQGRMAAIPFGFPTQGEGQTHRYGANFKYQAETETTIPDTAGKSVFVGGEVRQNGVLIGRYDWSARQLTGRGAATLGSEVVTITIALNGGSVPKTITLQGAYSPGNSAGKGGVSAIASGIPPALRNGTWSWTGSRTGGALVLDF